MKVVEVLITVLSIILDSSWHEKAAAGWKIPRAEEEQQTGQLPEQEEEEERHEGPQKAAQTAAEQEGCLRRQVSLKPVKSFKRFFW